MGGIFSAISIPFGFLQLSIFRSHSVKIGSEKKWKCVQNLCNLHRMGLYCALFSYIIYPHSNSEYLNFLSMRFCLLNIFMSKCLLNLLGFLEPIIEFDDGLISALKQTNISAYTTILTVVLWFYILPSFVYNFFNMALENGQIEWNVKAWIDSYIFSR